MAPNGCTGTLRAGNTHHPQRFPCMHGRKRPSLDSTGVAKDTLPHGPRPTLVPRQPVCLSTCCHTTSNHRRPSPFENKREGRTASRAGGTIGLDRVSWRDGISRLNKRPGSEVTRPRYVKRQKARNLEGAKGSRFLSSRHPYPQRPGVRTAHPPRFLPMTGEPCV